MKTVNSKIIVLLGVVGVSFSAIFVTYSTAPSLVLAFYRMGLATIMLLPFVAKNCREEIRRLPKKSILLSAVSGVFLAFHFTAYFEAIKFTSIASCTVLVDMEVFFVALVTFFLFKENIPKIAWLGIGITFAGSVIIGLGDQGAGSDVLYGDFLAVSGAAFMAVYTLIGRNNRKHMTTTLYTFWVYLAATLTLGAACLGTGTPMGGWGSENLAIGLGLALICTIGGHSIFSWGLKYVSAAFISTAKLGEPVFATILGILFFRQLPSLPQLLGGVVILSGIYLYTVKEST